MRNRHAKSEIEAALRYAEEKGFEVVNGVPKPLYVWSTPKNAGNHAKQIRRYVDRCPHK